MLIFCGKPLITTKKPMELTHTHKDIRIKTYQYQEKKKKKKKKHKGTAREERGTK